MRKTLMLILCFLVVLSWSGSPTQEYAKITTEFGEIVIAFFPEVAPRHVENFIKLAKEKFYNNTTFHRIIPGFMIQGGDPATQDDNRANDGMGIPGQKTLPAEFSDLKHTRGMVSMARKKNDINSATSQFFIMMAAKSHLDGKYTIFGKVIRGMDVVDTIVSQKRNKKDNPIKRIEMTVDILSKKK
jgi:peptidyl-prolyl cis-trans isomerase B (cyclophilin B)